MCLKLDNFVAVNRQALGTIQTVYNLLISDSRDALCFNPIQLLGRAELHLKNPLFPLERDAVCT
jgi:hypothetical protein